MKVFFPKLLSLMLGENRSELNANNLGLIVNITIYDIKFKPHIAFTFNLLLINWIWIKIMDCVYLNWLNPSVKHIVTLAILTWVIPEVWTGPYYIFNVVKTIHSQDS